MDLNDAGCVSSFRSNNFLCYHISSTLLLPPSGALNINNAYATRDSCTVNFQSVPSTHVPICPCFDDDDDDDKGVGGHPGGGSRVPMFEKPDTAVACRVLAESMYTILDTAVPCRVHVRNTGYCSGALS